MKKVNYYKLIAEISFTISYLIALLNSNTTNLFAVKLLIILFTILVVTYILYKRTQIKRNRLIVYVIFALLGLGLIFLSKYLMITSGLSFAIIVLGSLLCAPVIAHIEKTV